MLIFLPSAYGCHLRGDDLSQEQPTEWHILLSQRTEAPPIASVRPRTGLRLRTETVCLGIVIYRIEGVKPWVVTVLLSVLLVTAGHIGHKI